MRSKFFIPTAFILAFAVLFSACAKTGDSSDAAQEEPAGSDIVARCGSHCVTWALYQMTFLTYEKYYEEMGFDVYASAERLSGFQESMVESLLQQCVVKEEAISQGYNRLSAQQEQELADRIKKNLDSLDDTYRAQAEKEAAADPAVDVEARIRELIADESYRCTGTKLSYDAYLAWIKTYLSEQYYTELLQQETVSGVTVGAADVQSYYKKTLASDQATYEKQPELYKQAAEAGNTVPPLFAPAGYSKVRICNYPVEGVSKDKQYLANKERLQTIAAQYNALSIAEARGKAVSAQEKQALRDNYTALESENQKILDSCSDSARQLSADAYQQLQNGTAFSDLKGVEKVQLISLLYTSTSDFSAEIKTAFSHLKPGQYSEPFLDADGYHIIYYIEDEPAGARGFDTVQSLIAQSLLEQARSDAWQAQIKLWMQNDRIEKNDTLIHAMGKEKLSQ